MFPIQKKPIPSDKYSTNELIWFSFFAFSKYKYVSLTLWFTSSFLNEFLFSSFGSPMKFDKKP